MQFMRNLLEKFRSTLALLMPFIAALGVLATTSTQARAENLLTLANCVGSHSATWSPGVTNNPREITVSENSQWNCLQLRAPLLTTASSTNEFTAQFSCQSLLNPVPATWTIEWGDGVEPKTSTYVFTAQVNSVGNNLVIAAPGTITAGRHAGASAVGTFVLQNLGATLNNLCASANGVTNATGASTLLITGVAPVN